MDFKMNLELEDKEVFFQLAVPPSPPHTHTYGHEQRIKILTDIILEVIKHVFITLR